jgi:hypothetical protein
MSSKRVRILLLAVSVVLLSAAATQAATYWVHPSGSNANPCTNTTTPQTTGAKQTVAAGLGCLSGGDTLYIRSTGATVYQESIQGHQIPGGSSGAPTLIAGYQKENPVLRCNPCDQNLNGISVVIINSHITIRDLTIDGINAPSNGSCINTAAAQFILVDQIICLNGARAGMDIQGSNVTVRRSLFKGCGRIQPPGHADAKGIGISSVGTENMLFEYNTVDGCRGAGITNMQNPNTRNIVIRYNVVKNSHRYSPWGHDPAITTYNAAIMIGAGANYQVYGNVLYNGFGCIRAWGGAQNVQVFNNTCHRFDDGGGVNFPAYGIAFDPGTQGIVKNNLLSDVPQNGAIRAEGAVTQSNNLVNPNVSSTFVNAAAGNFKPLPGSAAIDKGANLGAPFDKDFSGLQRSHGCCYDIGAFEYGLSGGSLVAPINLQILP